MGFVLDPHSLKMLVGVHPDLLRVVNDCAANLQAPFTFGVTEGVRSLQQQKLDVAHGKSQTLRSRHLDGHAVDLVTLFSNKLSWAWPPYDVLAAQMKAAAARCGVPIEWGGDWTTLKDGCHFQLPWVDFPSGGHTPAPIA
jgi:peptidoglycan L-alanyl-D-glutamate endopeptidase CwlK